MTSDMAEAIEGYAETAKHLVNKWRDYASVVAANLESGYNANRASADLGEAVALVIETGGLLTWEALDAIDVLTAGLDRPRYRESEELSTQYKGAKLELREDLEAAFGRTLAADRATVIPSKLGSEDQKFKVRVDISGCRSGVYDGKVVASTPDDTEEVAVRIRVP